jgi:carbon starvation protein CstA
MIMAKAEKIKDKKLVSVMFIILIRYILALLLSMLPIWIGLKSRDYVISLVVFNFILQFVLASVQMAPYFGQIRRIIKE